MMDGAEALRRMVRARRLRQCDKKLTRLGVTSVSEAELIMEHPTR